MRPIGIDISKYDYKFEPENAEIIPDFIFQRASYGIKKDEAFDVLFPGVSKIKLRMGYHYLNSGISYKQQADNYLSIVKDCGFLAHVCDFEGYANTLSTEFAYDCWKWLDYIQQKTGKRVILYTGRYLYQDYIIPSGKKYNLDWDKIPLWIAQYNNLDPQIYSPTLPTGRNGGWTFWQFTDKGNGTLYGTGRDTKLDKDVFNGTLQELSAWLGVSSNENNNGGNNQMIYNGKVLVNGLRVRRGPSTSFEVVSSMSTNTLVSADAIQNGWWRLTSINNSPVQGENWAYQGDAPAGAVGGTYIQLLSTSEAPLPPAGDNIPAYMIGYDASGKQIARWDLVK